MRFYRGRETTNAGAGIGLALVKELVDTMKGRIEVKSRVGEGATLFEILNIFIPYLIFGMIILRVWGLPRLVCKTSDTL